MFSEPAAGVIAVWSFLTKGLGLADVAGSQVDRDRGDRTAGRGHQPRVYAMTLAVSACTASSKSAGASRVRAEGNVVGAEFKAVGGKHQTADRRSDGATGFRPVKKLREKALEVILAPGSVTRVVLGLLESRQSFRGSLLARSPE